MKSLPVALFALSLALPFSAQAQTAGRLNEQQLIQNATERNICEDRSVISARYVNDTENRVSVTCGDAEGFVPLAAAGLGGLGGAGAAAAIGLGVAALAAGGAGGTSDTQ